MSLNGSPEYKDYLEKLIVAQEKRLEKVHLSAETIVRDIFSDRTHIVVENYWAHLKHQTFKVVQGRLMEVDYKRQDWFVSLHLLNKQIIDFR